MKTLTGGREVTGVPTGLQNRVAALYVAGGFDSHMLPPKSTPLGYIRLAAYFIADTYT